MTTSYLTTFYMTTFYHRKIEKHYQAWNKKQQHTSQESLRNNREIKQSQRGKRFIATIPPTGVRRPYREPTGREPGFRITLDLRSAPTPSSPSQPSQPSQPPPPTGPPHSLPPSSKVVVLGLQVESRFFYPVIINLVYPILFSPLSRVATIFFLD